jgi:tRNA-dihydrouridine synthase A
MSDDRETRMTMERRPPRKLCVAPMMEWTDRHCRVLHRLLAPNAWLYSEMTTTGALIHGPRERLLAFSPVEHPLAIQLGGSDPDELARCTAFATAAGYDEINLNVGCPSARVQQARIGACLMREADLVARAMERMRCETDRPVTVKCRLGVDDDESYEFLHGFVATVAAAGCRTFIVHARKAILNGLSPAQNRSVPALDHARVLRLKRDFPALEIVVNGGIADVATAEALLPGVDGVMIGRAAYHDPWLLAALEQRIFGTTPPASRNAVALAYLPYVERQLASGSRLHDMTRHMLGLFNGVPGARRFRQLLSEPGARSAGVDRLLRALCAVQEPECRESERCTSA